MAKAKKKRSTKKKGTSSSGRMERTRAAATSPVKLWRVYDKIGTMLLELPAGSWFQARAEAEMRLNRSRDEFIVRRHA